jgi:signal transduction histidine kinase
MSPARVLIAEDESIVAANLQLRLESLGYAVVGSVDSGEEAVRQAEALRPDLVLMDIRLTGTLDGVAAAAQIRAQLDIPIIYLTAYTDDQTLERAKPTEPYGYLIKPFDTRELHTATMLALYKHSREKLRAIDWQRQKVELLAGVAAGLGAEFGDLLTVILGSTSAILADPPQDAVLRKFIGMIDTAARRAADLIQQMLAYTGQGRTYVEPSELNLLVEQVLAQFELEPGLVLRRELAPDLPSLYIDTEQIRQVLRSLLANAVEALAERTGGITVGTARRTLERSFIEQSYLAPRLQAGEYVELSVADSGIGMDEATRARMFEPFFSTKLPGRGMGLAVALGVVTGHQGIIDVRSAPGQGTTVCVLLPVRLPANARPI